MFKPGDKAVYPGHGVGEVVGIEHTEVAGQRQSFYVLKMLEKNGGRFLIPINKIGQEPQTNSPEQFVAFIRSETAKFAKITKLAGVKAE